ncbi:MAG: LamG-like jellyroll fold domain-containing protein [Paludibacter sp.]|nr:LamG-like jellyroll fold domain-containing protein [Paludibacter sp.]
MKRKHLLISLTLSVSVSLFSLPTNYIGLWPFDGDVKDYSGNNLNGSVNGNTVYVPGKSGQAISLNGNSYVNMGDISTLNIANSEFSIAVWIKTTSDTVWQCVISKFNSSTGYPVGGYLLETGRTAGNIRFQLGISSPNMVTIEAPANYYDDEWHQIVITRTADIIKMYFDGSVISSGSCTGMIFPNTNLPFSVGYFFQRSDNYFIGSIDDIKICNQALSESEISSIYNENDTNIWKKDGNNIYFNEGYVGIGTPTPSSCLDIVTKSPFNNASIALNTLDGAGQKYVIAATSNNNNNGQGFVIKDLTTNIARLKINSNGYVGFGTIDPSSPLDIETKAPATNACIELNALDGTGQKYIIASNSNNNTDGQGFAIKDMKTNTTRLKINSNGFVGIGTTDPTSPLDIETKSPANNASIELNTLDGNGQRYVIASTSNNNNNGQGFIIKDITNNTTRLKINSNGNVGIGTLDPSEKLEVDGNIFIKENNALILSSPNGTKFKITVDDNGNLTTSQITSTQSVKFDCDVTIFPNPTDNQITVKINQQDIIHIDAEIYTLTGKMIYMKSYSSNSFQINTSDLSLGAYILKLKDSTGNLIRADKFIKQ